MNLYELSQEFLEAEFLLNSAESDEEYQQALDLLTSIESDLIVKVDNIAAFVKNLDGEIKKFKEEEKRLSDKRKSLESKQKSLKSYIRSVFNAQNIDRVKGDRFEVKLQQNPQYSMNITDETNIPDEYYETIKQLNKRKLKEDIIENGLFVEGVELSKGQHIRIR